MSSWTPTLCTVELKKEFDFGLTEVSEFQRGVRSNSKRTPVMPHHVAPPCYCAVNAILALQHWPKPNTQLTDAAHTYFRTFFASGSRDAAETGTTLLFFGGAASYTKSSSPLDNGTVLVITGTCTVLSAESVLDVFSFKRWIPYQSETNGRTQCEQSKFYLLSLLANKLKCRPAGSYKYTERASAESSAVRERTTGHSTTSTLVMGTLVHRIFAFFWSFVPRTAHAGQAKSSVNVGAK